MHDIAARAHRPAAALAWGLALVLAGAALPAGAQLFPDNEARKAIVDLRAKQAADDEAQRQRTEALARQLNDKLAEQNKQLQDKLAADLQDTVLQLRRSLLELNQQLEQMRGELARLRGSDEQLARDLSEVQRRQKDLAQGIDERIRRVEPQQVTLDGKSFAADPEEKRQYEEAFAAIRASDFPKAADLYAAFLRRWPGSGFEDAARYWLGNAQYGKREYKEAIATFRAFVTQSPQHARAPEALLAIANCQIEMKDTKAAKATLAELLKAYPNAEASAAGKERLAGLK